MPDQLTDRARRAAEEIAKNLFDLRDITIDGDEMRSTDKDGVRGRGSKEWVVFGFTNTIERHMREMSGDMQRVRTLLRYIWQIHDHAGESYGRSQENEVIEMAQELLDYHFPRDNRLCEAFDSTPAMTLEEIRQIIAGRHHEVVEEAAPCQEK